MISKGNEAILLYGAQVRPMYCRAYDSLKDEDFDDLKKLLDAEMTSSLSEKLTMTLKDGQFFFINTLRKTYARNGCCSAFFEALLPREIIDYIENEQKSYNLIVKWALEKKVLRSEMCLENLALLICYFDENNVLVSLTEDGTYEYFDIRRVEELDKFLKSRLKERQYTLMKDNVNKYVFRYLRGLPSLDDLAQDEKDNCVVRNNLNKIYDREICPILFGRV